MSAASMVVDVSQDWAIACEVQERFMKAPRARTALTHSARCRQMRALGGDCFDCLPLPGRQIALAVADASGKGLPAALIISNVQSSLRTAALFAPEDVGAVVTAVNAQLHTSSPADRYATLFYSVFDEDTRTLEYVNAGHHPALIIGGSGAINLLEAVDPPVGLFADTVYHARRIELQAGDLILAYTDGVVEATDAAGEEWGAEGLLAALKACPSRNPGSIVDSAFAALDRFSRDGQTDDATILAALVN